MKRSGRSATPGSDPGGKRSAARRSAPKVIALPPPPPLPMLPAPLTPLIGREREAAELHALVRDAGVRLLTLTGPGGVGKTRLALEVAARLRAAFDGIAYVPFAAVPEPALVLPMLARSLGVSDQAHMHLLQRLQAALRARSLLLVLDNFEHLLPAAPLITELLAACPHVAALVTSRAPLHLSGERVYLLAPLALPELTGVPTRAAAAESAAVSLFVERARAIAADFELTDANASVVTEICVRLDGLPLAIELAAAQTRVLSPRSLGARLADRLPLLVGGPRDQPDRLRTMRNAIAWSHDLLAAEDQRLFRRLCVFAGGFTLEAAEAVVAEGGLPPCVSVLDGLTTLIDHSLVQQVQTPADESRYVMLEMIREYGLESLAEQGEVEVVRDAHAAYFLALAEEAVPALSGPDQQAWLDRLEAEHGNLRLALDRCRTRDPEAGLRLAAALSLFWQVRGYLIEGRRWLDAALASAPDGTPYRAQALLASGQIARHQADVTRGIALCEEGLAIIRAHGDKLGEASVLRTLGLLVWDGGDPARGRALFEESLALARQSGDDLGIARTLGTLGCLTLVDGDHAQARVYLEESLARFERMGDTRSVAVELGNLGHLAWDDGDFTLASRLFEENLARSRGIGNKRDRAYTVAWRGNLARSQGDARRAHAFLAESVGLHYQIGDKLGISYCLCFSGVLAVHRGDQAAGLRLMSAASIHHAALDAQLTPRERRDREAALAAARVALGEVAFERVEAEGRALSLEQAIAAALVESVEVVVPVEPAPSDAAETYGLTPRELEVLRLLVTGLTDREIAEALFISRKTVSKHVGAILAKLGVSSSRGAAAEAARRGLV